MTEKIAGGHSYKAFLFNSGADKETSSQQKGGEITDLGKQLCAVRDLGVAGVCFGNQDSDPAPKNTQEYPETGNNEKEGSVLSH